MTLRRVSRKRQKLNREANPWREAFKLEVGRCELCFKQASPDWLDVDEIARGSGHRPKALMARYAILCVHRKCHDEIQNWSRAKRLALLYLARSSDYDLDAYHTLTDRKWPSQEDVDREIALLLNPHPRKETP